MELPKDYVRPENFVLPYGVECRPEVVIELVRQGFMAIGKVSFKGIKQVIHILPINDIEEHTEDTTCKCQPTVKKEGEDFIIIHHAFDGRTALEEAQRILNNEK